MDHSSFGGRVEVRVYGVYSVYGRVVLTPKIVNSELATAGFSVSPITLHEHVLVTRIKDRTLIFGRNSLLDAFRMFDTTNRKYQFLSRIRPSRRVASPRHYIICNLHITRQSPVGTRKSQVP